MPRFTKLPVTIEAVRFQEATPGKITFDHPGQIPDWLNAALNKPEGDAGRVCHATNASGDPINALFVFTLEGTHTASPGDWIIQGVKGELYPCKPDIFEATYCPAPDEIFAP